VLAGRERHAAHEARSVVLANSRLVTFDERGATLGDRRMRKALALAIDRKALVDSLWLGRAVVPPSHNYPEFGEMFLAGRALFSRMLDAWEEECPGTILYQPLETYGVRRSVRWRPYTFYFMDLRADNLAFG
jgi:ABC-type oligopeptide transport system substrate-binding subunit